jgi:hypothetical protein
MPPGSDSKTTTLPAMNSGMNHKGPKASQWAPIYDGIRNSLPIAWQCPCGGLVHTAAGMKTCPKCGRIPRDEPPRPKHTNLRMKAWRKFGKERRC